MSIDKNSDANIPDHTEDYYEALASEEQNYLDEGVERLREREILVSEVVIDRKNNPGSAERPNPDGQVDHAAEELITGDSDDPPLSEETVGEMLRTTTPNA